ncbi:hypothetical protein D3C87_1805290 [compost metagenome]
MALALVLARAPGARLLRKLVALVDDTPFAREAAKKHLEEVAPLHPFLGFGKTGGKADKQHCGRGDEHRRDLQGHSATCHPGLGFRLHV